MEVELCMKRYLSGDDMPGRIAPRIPKGYHANSNKSRVELEEGGGLILLTIGW